MNTPWELERGGDFEEEKGVAGSGEGDWGIPATSTDFKVLFLLIS